MIQRPRMIGEPRPGFFRVRLVKGGPWVPARILRPCPIDPTCGYPLDRSPRDLVAEVDGRPVPLDRVWLFGTEIDWPEWARLSSITDAERHVPDSPLANPTQRIDLMRAPIPF